MERVSSQIHIRESSSSAEKERFWKKRGMSIFPCKWYLDGYAFWSHSFAVLTFMSGLSKLFPHGNSSLYCLVFVFLKAKKWKSLNILHSVFFNSWFYSSQCSLCPGSLKMLFFFPPYFLFCSYGAFHYRASMTLWERKSFTDDWSISV